MTIIDSSIRKESRDRYLTYALSVVSGRALPDVRDGLKPVQRRILYAMLCNLNLKPSANYRKSAAVVGEVLARFHPHGDLACYEAMVRMAQDFSYRYPLVDGQGNFGSLDGDSPAAYRYTEAKLTEIAVEVVGEIKEETVEFRPNFDSTTEEPVVLPSLVPNLLVNGASGIAVGMATNIPPHNLRDTIKTLIKFSKDSELSTNQLVSILKGPDFPTGCQILNSKKELSDIYRSGRGIIRMRGDWKVEEQARGKRFIVVSSVPYAINKSQLIEKIANLIIEKKIPQLLDIRDESTDTVRIVMELTSGADPDVAMAFIYKNSPLESNFSVNLTALVPTGTGACRPELLSLKQILQNFLDFRAEVVEKRLLFEKKNLKDRIHILEGLKVIFDNLDAALRIVRKSSGRTDAAQKLKKRFKLTETQSLAVVDMRIYQLSRTNIEEILLELRTKKKRVKEINAILKSKKRIAELVRKDLERISRTFGDARCSEIVSKHVEVEFNESDYVVQEEVFAIITSDGWIKRIRQTNELSSTRIREGDSILRAHPLTTHDRVAFFTNHGFLYVMKISDFPSSSGYGSPIQSLLKFKDGEKIIESLGIRGEGYGAAEDEYEQFVHDGQKLLLLSERGLGFGLEIEGLDTVKKNGKRVMKARKGDHLAAICHLAPNIAIFTRKGSALSIKLKDVPVRSQAAVGVILMGVRDADRVVACRSYSRSAKFQIFPESGKMKEIPSGKITRGRRGLKGTKILKRGEIKFVEKVIKGDGQISFL